MARDLAHSRPHLDSTKKPKNAIDAFATKARKNHTSLAALSGCTQNARIIPGDARRLSISDSIVDLIVTSPPYANAIDYMRAHKFSLIWLGDSVQMLTQLRSEYIGSEKVNGFVSDSLPIQVESVLSQLTRLDDKKAKILGKYFCEMRLVLREMFRVLRPEGCAVLVVGSSTMRGMDVETHLCLARVAENIGFDIVGVSRRQIDRNRRMMPARFGKKSESGIEQRMHDEYVIGLFKPHH